jgi:hypothetical protein
MTQIRLSLSEREARALLSVVQAWTDILDVAHVPHNEVLDSAQVKLIAGLDPLDAACGEGRR